MRAIVVYESMYGNTHTVAEAIGAGLGRVLDVEGTGEGTVEGTVEVVSVHDATPARLTGADLLVVGGPTHAHGMSRATTRASAVADAAKPEPPLDVDPDAEGDGLREWFDGLGDLGLRSAAFDTRVDMAAAFTGRASKGIAKRLRHHGCEVVAEPESFLVTKETHLEPHEAERAAAWGERLGALLAGSAG
jgi:hypothetical protein